jgi:hypothetical protein
LFASLAPIRNYFLFKYLPKQTWIMPRAGGFGGVGGVGGVGGACGEEATHTDSEGCCCWPLLVRHCYAFKCRKGLVNAGYNDMRINQ